MSINTILVHKKAREEKRIKKPEIKNTKVVKSKMSTKLKLTFEKQSRVASISVSQRQHTLLLAIIFKNFFL